MPTVFLAEANRKTEMKKEGCRAGKAGRVEVEGENSL
jgi:hypothetical protein